ncbi:unnamed protein product [Acanthoscelides obtectus]|uniref:Uncharacterized protein n=1 Tax=Acanthoscelides obtectus TaxID=200917 RepID=A0A9P0NXI4_ACAOB|nr:unnamed protein product [Acanthoscelides obtectus]CAK1672351.1 hypothetical protein AOBTE_LOCUS28813 [Acanthoscelides obtectus]
MKSNTSLVTARSRSKSIGSRLPEQDGGNRNALTICSDGKDIYSSILGPTADETLLLGLQTFLGFGSSGEDGSTRARIAGSTVQASEIEDKRKYSIAGGTSFGGESILGGETLLGADSILHGEILVGGESIVGGQGVVGGESMVGDQSLVGDVSLGGVSFGGVTGHASEGDATMSMKSRKVSPCKLKCPEKTYVEQGVQTLPPGYAIKCNKAVACPPRCRVGIQESGESILHLSDSMVGTDERFNFGGQTPGLRIGSSASQTGDLLNTSSSQTSRVNLSHASLQTQRPSRTERSCPSYACVPDSVGDSNPQGITIKYAITKITTFASYTTFEVMKCTRKKPRCMPSSIMGVFVLKNFGDCNG